MNAGPSPSAARTSVPMLPGSATFQRASPTGGESVYQAEEDRHDERRDRSRRVAERRDFREEARLDELAAGETLNRSAPRPAGDELARAGRERRLDEIFALTTEQPGAVALAAGRETADEPKPRVRRRGDHSGAPATRATGRGSPRASRSSRRREGAWPRPQWPCSPASVGRSRDRPAGTGGRLLERRDDPVVALLAQVADDRRREDNGQGTELPLREQVRQALDDVAALERRRLRAKRLDGVVEAFEPGRRSAQTNDFRSSVSSGRVRSIGERSTPLRWRTRGWRRRSRGHGPTLLAGQGERRVLVAPGPVSYR